MLSKKATHMQGSDDSSWHERVETYSTKLETWATETPGNLFDGGDLRGLWLLVRGTIHDVKPHSRRFIETRRDSVLETRGQLQSGPGARALVRGHETRPKGAELLVAIRPGERWSLDFVFDTFGVSRKLRILAVNDDCCRENLCLLLGTLLRNAQPGSGQTEFISRQPSTHKSALSV